METPAWKYGAAFIGLIAAGLLAVCNVLAAYGALTGDIERIALAIVMFVIVDVGVVAFLFGAVWLHRNGHPWESALFWVMWSGLSVVSVLFAANYINNRFESAQAPVEAREAEIEAARREWNTRLETEREHLREAERQALVAARQSIRNDAKEEAAASRLRIAQIESEKAGKPQVILNAPIKHELAGHGLAAAIAAWVISQCVWFGIAATGDLSRPRASVKAVPVQAVKAATPPIPPNPGTKFPRIATIYGTPAVSNRAMIVDSTGSADSTKVKRNPAPLDREQRNAEILRLTAANMKQKQIADMLGIGSATVNRVIAAEKERERAAAAGAMVKASVS